MNKLNYVYMLIMLLCCTVSVQASYINDTYALFSSDVNITQTAYINNLVTPSISQDGNIVCDSSDNCGIGNWTADKSSYYTSADAATFLTVNTGQGANELYAMDQDVTKASNIIFNNGIFNSILNVKSTGYFSDTIRFNKTTGDIWEVGRYSTSDFRIRNVNDGNDVIFISDSSGNNVCIDCITPSQKLTVNGNSNITGNIYGNAIYQNTNLVCDNSDNCGIGNWTADKSSYAVLNNPTFTNNITVINSIFGSYIYQGGSRVCDNGNNCDIGNFTNFQQNGGYTLGSFGIGTETPQTEVKLDVAGNGTFINTATGGSKITFNAFGNDLTNTNQEYIGANPGTGLRLISVNQNDISFGSHTAATANAAEDIHMFIEGTNGNVGIGTATPTSKLTVAGETNITGISGDGTGKAVCIKADGNLGTCSDAVGVGGTCTCA